jgi:hypothetical protein
VTKHAHFTPVLSFPPVSDAIKLQLQSEQPKALWGDAFAKVRTATRSLSGNPDNGIKIAYRD